MTEDPIAVSVTTGVITARITTADMVDMDIIVEVATY